MSHDAEKAQKEVTFHQEKSPHSRVIHVDGAFGGPSPRGGFMMALYNERFPVPRSVTHAIGEDGALGEETRRDLPDGVFREIEVVALMSLETMRALHGWLEENLRKMDGKAQEKAQKRGGKRS